MALYLHSWMCVPRIDFNGICQQLNWELISTFRRAVFSDSTSTKGLGWPVIKVRALGTVVFNASFCILEELSQEVEKKGGRPPKTHAHIFSL